MPTRRQKNNNYSNYRGLYKLDLDNKYVNFMKSTKARNLILILLIMFGIGLMIYPSFSNYINLKNSSRVINSYNESISGLDTSKKIQMLEDAKKYNVRYYEKGFDYLNLNEEDKELYNSLLDISSTGIMGYIDIPSLNIHLPIYHTTSESVLNVGVGHLEWSSLPTGGESTHTVLSGHRGLPSARLFTDIDNLIEGDLFYVTVLDEIMAYEVDQINIVLPEDISVIQLEPGRDLCTLVTCTPYGVNTHRLLVRGHRVDIVDKEYTINSEAIQIKPYVVAMFIAIPLLLILFIYVMIKK